MSSQLCHETRRVSFPSKLLLFFRFFPACSSVRRFDVLLLQIVDPRTPEQRYSTPCSPIRRIPRSPRFASLSTPILPFTPLVSRSTPRRRGRSNTSSSSPSGSIVVWGLFSGGVRDFGLSRRLYRWWEGQVDVVVEHLMRCRGAERSERGEASLQDPKRRKIGQIPMTEFGVVERILPSYV